MYILSFFMFNSFVLGVHFGEFSGWSGAWFGSDWVLCKVGAGLGVFSSRFFFYIGFFLLLMIPGSGGPVFSFFVWVSFVG